MVVLRPRGKAKKWSQRQRVTMATITGKDIQAAAKMVARVSPKLARWLSAPRVK